jgi:hypothetical protein
MTLARFQEILAGHGIIKTWNGVPGQVIDAIYNELVAIVTEVNSKNGVKP